MTINLQRRDILKFSAITSWSVLGGTFPFAAIKAAVTDALNDMEVMTWSGCEKICCGSALRLALPTASFF